MNKTEYNALIEEAKTYQGRRQNRYCNAVEINIMKALDRKRSLNGKEIRVYSTSGFVPNSYKYRADIDFVHRYYDADGHKHFEIAQTGASRSGGSGALITVNGRPYDN